MKDFQDIIISQGLKNKKILNYLFRYCVKVTKDGQSRIIYQTDSLDDFENWVIRNYPVHKMFLTKEKLDFFAIFCPYEILKNENSNINKNEQCEYGCFNKNTELLRDPNNEKDLMNIYEKIMEPYHYRVPKTRSFYGNINKGEENTDLNILIEEEVSNTTNLHGSFEKTLKLKIPTKRFFAILEVDFCNIKFRSYHFNTEILFSMKKKIKAVAQYCQIRQNCIKHIAQEKLAVERHVSNTFNRGTDQTPITTENKVTIQTSMARKKINKYNKYHNKRFPAKHVKSNLSMEFNPSDILINMLNCATPDSNIVKW